MADTWESTTLELDSDSLVSLYLSNEDWAIIDDTIFKLNSGPANGDVPMTALIGNSKV